MAFEGLSVQDVLRLARGVAADFDGVAVDGVAPLDGEVESVDLLLSLPIDERNTPSQGASRGRERRRTFCRRVTAPSP